MSGSFGSSDWTFRSSTFSGRPCLAVLLCCWCAAVLTSAGALPARSVWRRVSLGGSVKHRWRVGVGRHRTADSTPNVGVDRSSPPSV